MKSVFLAISAVILYALQNVVLEIKLARFNPFSLLILVYSVMLPLAIASWVVTRKNDQFINFPSGSLIVLALAMGVAYFFADTFYVSAYSFGGNVMTVASILTLSPVVASLIKYIWVGGSPNKYQLFGYVLAMFSIILITKGKR